MKDRKDKTATEGNNGKRNREKRKKKTSGKGENL